LHNPPANGKQWLIPEEMPETMLTNQKQENLDKVHAANIIKLAQTRINREKCTFCVIKSLEHQKNLTNWPHPLFRFRPDHACHQKPNPARD